MPIVRLDVYRRNLVNLQTKLQYGYHKFSKIWPIGFEPGAKNFRQLSIRVRIKPRKDADQQIQVGFFCEGHKRNGMRM